MQPRIDFQTYGGQLKQVAPYPIFYLSPLNLLSNVCLRGGQPIIFPQFENRGSLKKHGVARDVIWQIISDERASNRHRLILMREFAFGDVADWPYVAGLNLDIECVPGLIHQKFTVHNTGRSEFVWTGGLHPYFAVDDLMNASIYGLMGVPYIDRYGPERSFTGAEYLSWSEAPCEKLFNAAPELILETGSYQIKLQTSGFDQWMVWNPGKEAAKAFVDLPDADWNKFVCVEPVCIDRPVALKPGEKFVGMFNISIARPGIPKTAFL